MSRGIEVLNQSTVSYHQWLWLLPCMRPRVGCLNVDLIEVSLKSSVSQLNDVCIAQTSLLPENPLKMSLIYVTPPETTLIVIDLEFCLN